MTILDEKMAKELLNNGKNHVVIPDFVTEIGEGAFKECRELISVVIPKSVTKIEEWAFLHCDDLKFVNIENSEIQIEKYAFCRCRNISEESKKRLKELGYDFDEE